MASSGNIATWNPLDDDRTTVNFLQGNLETKGDDSNWAGCKATFLLSSGKWYWEALSFKNAAGDADGNGWTGIGITIPNHIINGPSRTDSEVNLYVDNGYTRGKGGNTDQGTSWSEDDIIGVAYDADNGTIQFLKNNSSVVTLTGSDVISAPAFPCALVSGSSTYNHTIANFGQDSTFGGAVSAGGNSDGNGNGDFKYSPPSGFLAVCSANLPISADIDPAGDDGADENPTKQFFMTEYLGNLSNRTVTTENQADLIFIRHTNFAQNWYVVDSNRGITNNYYLKLDDSIAEATFPQSNFQSIGSTSVGISSGTWLNSTGAYYQMWMWHCNGGTTSTNNEGNHTCTLQANAKAGCSIMTLANYTSASGVTIGHGLDTAPSMYWHKSRSSSGNWHVYHSSLGATKAMLLNSSNSEATAIGYWANTEPTADVLSLGNTFAGTSDGIVYAWSEIEGYSKFSSYVGNGDADGPFVYTGLDHECYF